MNKQNKKSAKATPVDENLLINDEIVKSILSSSNPRGELVEFMSNWDKSNLLHKYLISCSFNADFELLLLEKVPFKDYVDTLKDTKSYRQKERFLFLCENHENIVPELIYDYYSNSCFNKEFERIVAKQEPEVFIKAIRTNLAFMNNERFEFYSKDKTLKIPIEHLETWKVLKESEGLLWSEVEKRFATFISNEKQLSPERRFCSAMKEIIIWMERKRWGESRDIRGELWVGYNLFVEKYCRDLKLTTLNLKEDAEEMFLDSVEGVSPVAQELFDAIYSWVSYKISILDSYCFDMTFNAKMLDGALILSQSPQDYYLWKLNGCRYDINRAYYKNKGEIKTDDLPKGTNEIGEMEQKDSDLFFATSLLLNDLCLDKINWDGEEIETIKVFRPLIRLSTDRLIRYENALDNYKLDGIKTWEEAVSLNNDKQGVKVLPFNVYTKELFIQQTKEVGFTDEVVKPISELFNLFCFKFNDEPFDRFKKRSYDVMSKPFLEIGENTYFTPTMFLANNDWFYSSAQKMLEFYNRKECQRIKKESSTRMEQSLADLFGQKGWKTYCFHDGDKKTKGDVDIIVEDEKTALLIQLKRTLFRLDLSAQYLEMENIDIKAVCQLNSYQYLGEKKKVVRWYVTNSYENCLKEFTSENGISCRKLNYLDILQLLTNVGGNWNSLDELIEYASKDKFLKNNKSFFFDHPEIPMPIPCVMPCEKFLMTLEVKDVKPYEQLNGIIANRDNMDLDERLRIAEELSEIIPNDYTLWDELSFLYTEKGMFDKAIECSRKALEIIPGDPSLTRNLACTIGKERMSHKIILPAQHEECLIGMKLNTEYWFLDFYAGVLRR